MRKSGRLLAAILLILLLQACGQTGALYAPDNNTDQQAAS